MAHKGIFCSNGNVLKLDCGVMIAQFYESTFQTSFILGDVIWLCDSFPFDWKVHEKIRTALYTPL